MKNTLKTLLVLSASTWTGAAWAHDSAVGHIHPHAEGAGGDALLVAATLLAVGAALALWTKGRTR